MPLMHPPQHCDIQYAMWYARVGKRIMEGLCEGLNTQEPLLNFLCVIGSLNKFFTA